MSELADEIALIGLADKLAGLEKRIRELERSKEAEMGDRLDKILEDFYDGDIRQSDMGKAKQALLDWHNEQIKNAVATAEDNLDQYWNKKLDKQVVAALDKRRGE